MNLVRYYNKPLLSDFFNNDFSFNNFVKDFMGSDTSSGLVNVSETEKDYNLEIVLPGYKKEDINIEMDNDILTVKAQMKNEKEEKNKKYLRKEFISSTFSRSFSLPEDASDKVDAKMNDGILSIVVNKVKPEKEQKKLKTISIT